MTEYIAISLPLNPLADGWRLGATYSPEDSPRGYASLLSSEKEARPSLSTPYLGSPNFLHRKRTRIDLSEKSKQGCEYFKKRPLIGQHFISTSPRYSSFSKHTREPDIQLFLRPPTWLICNPMALRVSGIIATTGRGCLRARLVSTEHQSTCISRSRSSLFKYQQRNVGKRKCGGLCLSQT